MTALKRAILTLCCGLLLVGCTPATTDPAAEPLPTLFPTSTPVELNLENAERAAQIFLTAWQMQDFEAMFAATSAVSQSSMTFERFQAAYTNVQDIMSFERLTYQPRAIERDRYNPRLADFVYDVTFHTRLLGQFTDPLRRMKLIFDATVGEWRVAWSEGDIFPEIARGGQLRLESTPVTRANIYDRDGVVLASQDGRVVQVRLVKREVADLNVCFETLVQALDTPADLIRARLNIAADDWLTEVGLLDVSRFGQWEAALVNDCSAQFSSMATRLYPNGSLAPHIVGSVGFVDEAELPAIQALGFNQEAILGRSGVERSWDATLRGTPGITLRITAPGGGVQRTIASSALKLAESVWLTIDADLQQQVLNILTQAYANNAEGWARNSRGASVIIMDIHTGEILALVSYPTFDANALAAYPSMGRQAAREIIQKMETDERLPMLNRATQGRYPTGSVMKIASVAAAADSGVFALNQRFNCGGLWNRLNTTRTDWLRGGHGLLNLQGVITQSCNIYTYEIGFQMNEVDPFLLPNYFRRFGFGLPTGLLDVPEDPGFIGDPDSVRLKRENIWTFVDAISMAIGQGEVEATPLQVTRMVAAVANGGRLLRPRLVQKTGLLNEFSYIAEPEVMGNLDIDPEVLKLVADGMCTVTTALAGTATYQFEYSPLQSIGVCGKTGTAQNLNRGALTHAWFAAFAPRDKPQIAIVVMVEDAGEGSGVAAPITRDILEYYFFESTLVQR